MDNNETFLTLKNLLDRKLNIYWHYSYLEKYVSGKIVPFGLRLKLFPHFSNPSNDFKSKWENTLTDCSLALLRLLIDEHKHESALLDAEIQACNIKIAALNTPEGLAQKERELNNGLEKVSHDMITKKEKKLVRDRRAFATSKAYYWPTPYQSKSNRRVRNATPRREPAVEPAGSEPMGSDSSQASTSSI